MQAFCLGKHQATVSTCVQNPRGMIYMLACWVWRVPWGQRRTTKGGVWLHHAHQGQLLWFFMSTWRSNSGSNISHVWAWVRFKHIHFYTFWVKPHWSKIRLSLSKCQFTKEHNEQWKLQPRWLAFLLARRKTLSLSLSVLPFSFFCC